MRKERAGGGRGSWYWRAHRKRHGRLHRYYLGPDVALTVPENQSVHQLVARLVEHAQPAPPLARLRARGLVAECASMSCAPGLPTGQRFYELLVATP